MVPNMADSPLQAPITLNGGLTLPNRLVKAAMAETLAQDGMPTEEFYKLYQHFADGGWGMVLTGNVQVDTRYLGQPLDIAYSESIGKDKVVEAWKPWADMYKDKKTALVMQISHPGRQSIRGQGRGFWSTSIAPSAIPMKIGQGWFGSLLSAFAFGTPREMTQADIDYVVRLFRDTARAAYEAGFDGVQVHGAHGYLVSQFLSTKSNHRTDAYGGTPAKRARFAVEIIKAIREVVPSTFCVGIKMNSVDHQQESDMTGWAEQLELITAAGLDFLEVSGGDYEKPIMLQTKEPEPEEGKSERTKAREAYFIEFAKAIRARFPKVPLMVTGGFRSREGMEAAVSGGDCDLVGIARPAALNPSAPNNTVLNPELKLQEATLFTRKISTPWLLTALGIGSSVGGGAETKWYADQMKKYVLSH